MLFGGGQAIPVRRKLTSTFLPSIFQKTLTKQRAGLIIHPLYILEARHDHHNRPADAVSRPAEKRGEIRRHPENKYLRDIQRFALWLGDTPLERDAMLDYKADLMRHYAAGSVNSILAALNRFLRMIAREDCRVHRLRIQYQAYSPEEREITAQEYADLVRTARETGRARLALVLQTICATGIRVSELPAITAEAARRGVAVVRCKGKSRRVLIPTRLQKKLLRYMKQHRIAFGPVFVTRSGAPLDRSNIWREMKALCRAAGVSDKKVFPHNFRHLFARTFYRLNKDLAKLADLLGHSSINTTRIYIRTTSAEHRRCLERMRLVL